MDFPLHRKESSSAFSWGRGNIQQEKQNLMKFAPTKKVCLFLHLISENTCLGIFILEPEDGFFSAKGSRIESASPRDWEAQ